MDSLTLSPTSSNISLARLADLPHSKPARMSGFKKKNTTAVPRHNSEDGVLMRSIEVVDIDLTYRPPVERPPKVTACFYVQFPENELHPHGYYQAIYLTECSVRDLLKNMSEKHQIDPSRIVCILHVNEAGLRATVDDDIVRELRDGQGMIVDIYKSRVLRRAVTAHQAPRWKEN